MAKEGETQFSVASIFDIAYHESVAGLLRPAFKYVVKVLVNKYPRKLGLFWQYVDEFYACFELVLQTHYLEYYHASVSENFYNLKRINVEVGKNGSRSLTNTQIKLSLLSLVILPYIKTKLDAIFEKLRDKAVREGDNYYYEQHIFLRIFLKVYPYFHFALHCPFAVYQLGFTLNLFTHHNPIFHIFQMQLIQASASDILSSPVNFLTTSDSMFRKLAFLPIILIDKAIQMVSVVMPAVLFFLQFLQWWYSTNHEVTRQVTSLPIPPPPKSPKVVNKGCGLPSHPLQCPLCHKVCTNMAALVSSGFVFCYPCIYQYVMENAQCPVTQYPTNLDQILRIYSL